MDQTVCFKNILLADDGSDHALASIQLLLQLPIPSRTHVTVLRVFGTQQASELSVLEGQLNDRCDLLKVKGLDTIPELLLGYPAEKIIEYAEQHHPDLIVVGARGLRATLGILLGGVAQQVIEYASCPVLVVRAPMGQLKNFLLVVDGSQNSRAAAECLAHFPFPEGAELAVMHVLPPHYRTSLTEVSESYQVEQPIVISEETARQRSNEEREASHLLDQMMEILAPCDRVVKPILARGDAATEIIDHVRKNQVDLIIAGSRGLSRMRSWLLGSVSRKLVHYSGCSVLIVRGKA
jgi:nucleotide-binding universal stress UspA family protein